MYSKEFFSIQSHKNLESHRWVGRQEVFQFLYYCYHVWLSCNSIRCGLLAGHKFVSRTQGKKKTKNIEKFCWVQVIHVQVQHYCHPQQKISIFMPQICGISRTRNVWCYKIAKRCGNSVKIGIPLVDLPIGEIPNFCAIVLRTTLLNTCVDMYWFLKNFH